jgi:hypothetical protein
VPIRDYGIVFLDRRGRRHAADAHELRRLALQIQFPARAAGTGFAIVQGAMFYRHLW